jgi:succinate dehydrogenase / fumarate reductase iron-sulfur subunit
MKITLKVWRQKNEQSSGKFESYTITASPHMSFLEMLDVPIVVFVAEGKYAIAFDDDCRVGICGMCSLVINGLAHGKESGTTTCQLHMRSFKDGEVIHIEPFRAKGFPVIKDLVVNRSSFDRIVQSGGFISANTGGCQDANAIPIGKDLSDRAFAAATCIGCGACVAACKNSSAMLFVSAKVAQLSLLPQGKPERAKRVLNMVAQADKEGFGNCTNTFECEAVCPKSISVENIALMNREYIKATLLGREE